MKEIREKWYPLTDMLKQRRDTDDVIVRARQLRRIIDQTVEILIPEIHLETAGGQGGDRRFARYAADAKTAEQASLNARKTASGPSTATATKKAPAAKVSRKRAGGGAQAAAATK